MRTGWRIAVIWACLAARLAFYAAMLPLWEGYDEWAHFAVIRTLAERGGFLVARQSAIPRDVEASLELAPVPWEMRHLPPPAVTQDVYWSLPREERAQREASFRTMPAAWSSQDGAGALTAYEALQPPLYYWMMAPVLRLLKGAGLPVQVMAIRWLSALLASLTIPLVYAIARAVFTDVRMALGCAALVAVMPGFALDVARVGNDCLAVVLFTVLTWLGLRAIRDGLTYSTAACMGLALGLGLLTKAYFLTALPPLLLLFAYDFRQARRPPAAVFRGALIVASASVLMAGWWYARNLLTTGTISGLSEAVMLRDRGLVAMIPRAASIHWGKAVDSILFSHLYFGGWSSLTARSWMYHVFYAVAAVAAIGLVRLRRRPAVVGLACVYAAFWIGQLYNVLLIYLSKGVGTSMGWYLYAAVGAEVALCTAGLCAVLPVRARRWTPAAGVFLFAWFDLYTIHGLAIPYYTGLIRHKANGATAGLHWADLRAVGWDGAFERLAAFKGPAISEPMLIALWLLYLLATLAVIVAARAGPPQPQESRRSS